MSRRFFVIIMSLLMITGSCFAQTEAPELLLSDDTVSSGGIVVIPVSLKGASGICALQFAIHLPENVIPIDPSHGYLVITPGIMCADHEVSYNYENRVIHVVCLSMTNTLFRNDSGVVCYVGLQTDSLAETTDKLIYVSDIEMSTPDVVGLELDDICSILTVKVPEIIPEIPPTFSISIAPFTFTGSFESTITITSDVDIRSIAFDITVPQGFVQQNLIRMFGQLLASQFQTSVVPLGSSTYRVSITPLKDTVVVSGITDIIGIAVKYDPTVISPGIYSFSFDNIAITVGNGKTYYPNPFDYQLDLTFTQVSSPDAGQNGSGESYFEIGGIQTSGFSNGITIIRHADGTAIKTINR